MSRKAAQVKAPGAARPILRIFCSSPNSSTLFSLLSSLLVSELVPEEVSFPLFFTLLAALAANFLRKRGSGSTPVPPKRFLYSLRQSITCQKFTHHMSYSEVTAVNDSLYSPASWIQRPIIELPLSEL